MKRLFSLSTAAQIVHLHRVKLGIEVDFHSLFAGEWLERFIKREDPSQTSAEEWIEETTAFLSRALLGVEGKDIIEYVRKAVNPELVRKATSSIPSKYRNLIFSEDVRRHVFFTEREKNEISAACPPPFLFFKKSRGLFKVIIPLEVVSVLKGEVPDVHPTLPALSFLLRKKGDKSSRPCMPSPVDVVISFVLAGVAKFRNGKLGKKEVKFVKEFTGAEGEVVKFAQDFTLRHLCEEEHTEAFVPEDIYRLVSDSNMWVGAVFHYLCAKFPRESSLLFLMPAAGTFSLKVMEALSKDRKTFKELTVALEAFGMVERDGENAHLLPVFSKGDSKIYVHSSGEFVITGEDLRSPVVKLSPFARIKEISESHVTMRLSREALLKNKFRFNGPDEVMAIIESMAGGNVSARVKGVIQHEWAKSSQAVIEQTGWKVVFADSTVARRAEAILKAKGKQFLKSRENSIVVKEEDVQSVSEALNEAGVEVTVKKRLPTRELLTKILAIVRMLAQMAGEGKLRDFFTSIERETSQLLGEKDSTDIEKEYLFLLQYFGMLSRNFKRSRRSENRSALIRTLTRAKNELKPIEVFAEVPYPEGKRTVIAECLILEIDADRVLLWRSDRNFCSVFLKDWIQSARVA